MGRTDAWSIGAAGAGRFLGQPRRCCKCPSPGGANRSGSCVLIGGCKAEARGGGASTTTDWRHAADACCGAVDRALDLDVSDGVFVFGGRLQRRRLPSDIILGGDGDGDDAKLRSGLRRVIGDAERRLDEGYI